MTTEIYSRRGAKNAERCMSANTVRFYSSSFALPEPQREIRILNLINHRRRLVHYGFHAIHLLNKQDKLIDQPSRIKINPVVTTPDTAVINHFNATKVLLLNFSTGLNNISFSSHVIWS